MKPHYVLYILIMYVYTCLSSQLQMNYVRPIYWCACHKIIMNIGSTKYNYYTGKLNMCECNSERLEIPSCVL